MGACHGMPKAVPFLIGSEFCERFNYYGLRAVVSIYITEELGISEREATMIWHFFAMLVYTLPLVGATISDSWLGKFKTIFYISLIYATGNLILALSAVGPLNLPPKEFFLIGLFVIAVGTGGIKPCVSAFGGDQFELPEQARLMDIYFHMFYFSINTGSFLASFITPLLRKRVQCFGKTSCYSLAFFVPAILMVLAVIMFVVGKPLYNIRQPQGAVVVKIVMCIGNAIKNKCKSKGVKKDHWLDFAVEDYGEKLVNDVKIVFKVLVIYIPIPLFWALFEQLATSWIFLARRMDGELGNFYTILPDQMAVMNPVIVLMLIPLFTHVVYPLFAKIGLLERPLQRMCGGGLLAAASFVITAFLALGIEAEYPTLPRQGNAQIRIFNVLPCDITIKSEILNRGNPIVVQKLSFFSAIDIPVKKEGTYGYEVSRCSSVNGDFLIREKEASAYFFTKVNSAPLYIKDEVDKLLNGNPNSRLVVAGDVVDISYLDHKNKKVLSFNSSDIALHEIPFPGKYFIVIGKFKTEYKFRLGGVYTSLAIADSADKFEVNTLIVTKPNGIHVLFMLPQYVVITAGEVMLSITGIEFAYSQAPKTMKSVLQACWLLNSAIGQAFVVLLHALHITERPSTLFFIYATVMLLVMLLFIFLSMRYKYVTIE